MKPVLSIPWGDISSQYFAFAYLRSIEKSCVALLQVRNLLVRCDILVHTAVTEPVFQCPLGNDRSQAIGLG